MGNHWNLFLLLFKFDLDGLKDFAAGIILHERNHWPQVLKRHDASGLRQVGLSHGDLFESPC